MTKCIIIDDEPLAIKLLSSYVEKIDELSLLESFSNPIEAINYIKQNEVNLIFLDIQMPELNGMDFAKLVDQNTKIIFTTAYPDYAVEGFELKALDYLVKPISFPRFAASVDRIKSSSQSIPSTKLEEANHIFVKTEYRLQRLNLDDIYYLKGMGDYCQIVYKEGQIMTLENMKSLEQRMNPFKFVRIHKSYIVAIDQIEFVERNRVKLNDAYLPISATYEQNFKDRLK